MLTLTWRPMSEVRDLHIIRWKQAALAGAVIFVLSLPVAWLIHHLRPSTPPGTHGQATYTGGDQCIECHRKEYLDWKISDHAMAMAPATPATVEGDFSGVTFTDKEGTTSRFYMKDSSFYVHTRGPGGHYGDFRITYTFGVRPLQQYLVPFDSGRLQCLPLAWDTERKCWYSLPDSLYKNENLTPDNWLYWTNNGQNWNGMCADCHSTNLRKGYDPDEHTYHTTWTDINVHCEACHGPGSEHIRWARLPRADRPEGENYWLTVNTSSMTTEEEVKLCARCHARRSVLSDFLPEHFHRDMLDQMVPQLLNEPHYFSDGQILDEDYVWGSFTQSYMYQEHVRVRCSDCHNVHSGETILPDEDNQLCLQCHRADVYDTYAHTFHHKAGEGGKPLFLPGGDTVAVGEGALCVNCHMPGRYYMGVDYRRDHSLRIPRPDLSVRYGTPNACTQCHTDKSDRWAARHMRQWYGISRRHHYGEVLARGRRSDPAALDSLILLSQDILFPVIVRATALTLLQNYPVPRSFDALVKAFSDPEALIREAAVRSLPNLHPDTFRTALEPMLLDPVKAVRIQAAFRLSAFPRRSIGARYQQAYRKALEEYREAMLYMGDFASSRHNLGILYTNLGQTDRAIHSYEEALRIDNLFYPARINLALLYNQKGENDKAEEMLRKTLEQEPDFAEGYYYLGLLRAEEKDLQGALTYLLEAARRMPHYTRVKYNLALLYQQTGQPRKAWNYLQECLQDEPYNYDYLYAAASFAMQKGDRATATKYARMLSEHYPDSRAGRQLLQTLSGSYDQ